MNQYTLFRTAYSTRLTWDDFKKALIRLNVLESIMEGSEGTGKEIWIKAVRARSKAVGFTGRICLNRDQKDMLEAVYYTDESLDSIEREALEYYINR